MEFILDTADLEAVKQLDELLTIDGVTTKCHFWSSCSISNRCNTC